MRIDLHGGFGEKGRTCVGVSAAGLRLLFDAGIKVGATGREYYPAIEGPANAFDALFLTHAHEDHVGALSWLLAAGFSGTIFMTAETLEEAPGTLRAYADPAEVRAHPIPRGRVELFRPGDTLRVGAVTIRTGRSGHVAGGTWFLVEADGSCLGYAGDVLPDSDVFVMDAIPPCDLLLLDASYGADPISPTERSRAVSEWIARHPGTSLLPTPLHGRSLELIALIKGPFAIEASMRGALEGQIAAGTMLHAQATQALSQRLAAAQQWREGEPLPDCPLLADDGMGFAGPSATLLPRYAEAGLPIVLTGHLPSGTIGQRLHDEGRADWIRLPTHPTLGGNLRIWDEAGRPPVLGHSCVADQLVQLASHVPTLRPDFRTGQSLTLSHGAIL